MGAKKTPKKKTPTKKAGKAAKPAKTKGKPAKTKTSKRPPRPVKPAPARKTARNLKLPGIADDRANADLDEMATEAYDSTITWQAAGRTKTEKRSRLQAEMKKRGLTAHDTDDGIIVRIKKTEEKLTLKREEKLVELDEDDGDDADDDDDVTEDAD